MHRQGELGVDRGRFRMVITLIGYAHTAIRKFLSYALLRILMMRMIIMIVPLSCKKFPQFDMT